MIHFLLGPTPHHPRRTVPVAGQRPGDKLDLWVPGLAGIEQIAAGRDRLGQTRQRRAHRRIFGEQLVQARNDANRGGLGQCGKAGAIEGVALLERETLRQTVFGDQAPARRYVGGAKIPQQARGRNLGMRAHRVQNIATMAGGDVHEMNRPSRCAQVSHGPA